MENIDTNLFSDVLRKRIPEDGIDFKQKIRWLLIARFVLFLLIMGAVLILFSAENFLWKLIVLYGVITLGYLLTLFWAEKTLKKISFGFICAIQLIFELLVETAIIHYSGGAISPFVILLGLSIITSAFIFNLTGTLLTATGAVLLYVAVVILEYNGILDVPKRFPMSEMLYNDSELLFFTTYVYTCFLYLIAFLIGYLSERLKIKVGQLLESDKALARMKMDTNDILMHMKSGLVTLDPAGRIIYFNKAAGELLDVDPASIKGKSLSTALPERARPFYKKLSELLETGGRSMKYGEFYIRQPDGDRRAMHISTSFLFSPENTLRGIIALFEDITERKRREEYLKEVEKMATIGELSASLAHEIRNPLAAIRASVESLADSENTVADDYEKRLMKLIVKETDRLTRVLDEFLVFARIKELPSNHIIYNRIEMSSLISEVLQMIKMHPTCTENIEIKSELDAEIWALGREDQLKDVFYNLLINAVEAIGENKGTIIIKKEKEMPSFMEQRKLVGISVSDTGTGIPEEILPQIFTPFFSTKPRGTGLGLAIAQGIINRHQGTIIAENLTQKGAKFTVYLLKAPEKPKEIFE